METRYYNGITYRTKHGMVISIKTTKGWRRVWNSSGVSKVVRALLDGRPFIVVNYLALTKGNQI